MSKLYTTIKTDLIDPDLEAKIDLDTTAEPIPATVPNDLYAAIITNTPEASAEVGPDTEPRTFSYSVPNRLYTQIVPEKPSILAEERIFVYVPKVAYNSPGIAKFAMNQFNVIAGEVSIKSSYLAEMLASNLLTPDVIVVVAQLPTIGLPNRIYLVPINAGSSSGHLWNDNTQTWTSLGTMVLDMTNYYTKAEVQELVNTTIGNMEGDFGMIQVSNTAPTSPMVKLWAYVKEEI